MNESFVNRLFRNVMCKMMPFIQSFKFFISNLTGDQPGTGVGAIVGEEPNRCVNFCVCSNCNELEIDNESEIDNDLEIESEDELVIESDIENESIPVDQVNNENIRPGYYPSDLPLPQFTTNWPGTNGTVAPILNGLNPTRDMLPPLDEPVFYGYGHILNGNAPTEERPPLQDEPTFTIAHISNRPRPSPYTLEDRPRKSSNRRHLGR